jgi:hypothetical protein
MQVLQLKLSMGLLEHSTFLDSMFVKLIEDDLALKAFSRMLSPLTRRSAQQVLQSWCKRTLESGVLNQRTVRAREKRRRT